jgi:hypothetical protein
MTFLGGLSLFECFLVRGPDPVDPDEPPSTMETLLPWPVRLLVILLLWLAGFMWYQAAPVQQLAWGLAYAGAIAVSLAASLWWQILLLTVFLGLTWLLLTRYLPPQRERHPLSWRMQHVIEFCNRQLSHIEAFWLWSALVVTWIPRIHYQVPLLAAVYLLGPPLINGLTQQLHRRGLIKGWRSESHRPLSKVKGELQSARRPLIHYAALLGLLLLVLRSLDAQIWNLLPLAVAIGAGAALRLRRHALRGEQVANLHDPQALETVRTFRAEQRKATRRADVGLGPLFLLGGLAGLLGYSAWQRDRVEKAASNDRDGPPPPTEFCQPERGGPIEKQVRLFLLADTQLHELGGDRFPGQLELADALVPVALRPVELDMLSAAPIWRFGQHFHTLAKEKGAGPLFWAHLGDFADLGCTGELERATELLASLPRDRLAGLAPGNHDLSFTGNFLWSPFWTAACRSSARLDKRAAVAAMTRFAGQVVHKARGAMVQAGGFWLPTWLGGRGGALVTVTPLGPVTHQDVRHDLAAIFLDTADGRASDWGLAGMFGTFSDNQAAAIKEKIQELQARGALSTDPRWLLFAHHPLSELTDGSRGRLLELLAWLDDPPGLKSSKRTPRTLAVVTAHTHRAEAHRHCIGSRTVRELVVGSTIDPPQQAALLEIGPDASKNLSVRLSTVPLVARPGRTCGPKNDVVSVGQCKRIVARLKRTAACAPLFVNQDAVARDCDELEAPVTFRQRLAALARSRGAFEPDDVKREQNTRAAKLMACVCREEPADPGAGVYGRIGSKNLKRRLCEPPAGEDLFAGEAYHAAIYARLQAKVAGESDFETDTGQELACLAWAAGAVQAHKAAGMTFADALRCAFDDPTLAAAQESIATLEMNTCP